MLLVVLGIRLWTVWGTELRSLLNFEAVTELSDGLCTVRYCCDTTLGLLPKFFEDETVLLLKLVGVCSLVYEFLLIIGCFVDLLNIIFC